MATCCALDNSYAYSARIVTTTEDETTDAPSQPFHSATHARCHLLQHMRNSERANSRVHCRYQSPQQQYLCAWGRCATQFQRDWASSQQGNLARCHCAG